MCALLVFGLNLLLCSKDCFFLSLQRTFVPPNIFTAGGNACLFLLLSVATDCFPPLHLGRLCLWRDADAAGIFHRLSNNTKIKS